MAMPTGFYAVGEAIFREVTDGIDVSGYEDVNVITGERVEMFSEMYTDLKNHGFDLRPLDESVQYLRSVRVHYGPALEHLIDDLLCPRGFWAHDSRVHSWSSQHEIARYDASY